MVKNEKSSSQSKLNGYKNSQGDIKFGGFTWTHYSSDICDTWETTIDGDVVTIGSYDETNWFWSRHISELDVVKKLASNELFGSGSSKEEVLHDCLTAPELLAEDLKFAMELLNRKLGLIKK